MQTRDADGKYGYPETEYQLDWLKGIVYGRKCQKCSILNSRIQRQFQKKFSCQAEDSPSQKQKDKERQGIKENTSLSNRYWRFY